MKPQTYSGFTLIEVMIVLAIVGILSAIAYPSYQSHIVSTRRSTATGCLSEVAQQMERRFTASLSYNSTTTLPIANCTTDLTGFYALSFSTGEPNASTYKIQAIPQGAQTRDVCGTLTLDQKGVKGVGGSTLKNCWK